jgi:hypothetical protein
VDRLEHGCDLAHLGRRHMAEDGAVPVHDGVLEEAAITTPARWYDVGIAKGLRGRARSKPG